jgi:hypothetical protein
MKCAIAAMLLWAGTAFCEDAPGSGTIVGVWNFNAAKDGVVENSRPGGGGVKAVLKDFDPKLLAGTDVDMADFSVARGGTETTVKVAKSGWATFANVPDNGLMAGVNTPVGKQALAIFSNNPGNWVHFPGLATEVVGKPGGSIRTFGIGVWYLLQTTGKEPQFANAGVNCLWRFCQTDARIQTFNAIDRFYTEDVGNGLGGGYGYKIPAPRTEAAAARWVHVAISADGTADKFQMWVNGEKVQYRGGTEDAVTWPKGGGMQLNFAPGELTDGAVIGRWLGGAGASGKTMGLAAVVVTKGETIDQKRAQYLYELGRRGISFDGNWFSRKIEAGQAER